MRRGKTDAETCHLNGWTVGTRLVGTEGHGPKIEITAVGRHLVLAVDHQRESVWTFSCREWEACT